MKATFHISKVMKDSNGSVRKIWSMERIMTIWLATEMIQKKIAEFYIKKNNILETVRIVKTEKGILFKSYLNNKETNTFDTLPKYN